LPDPFDLIALVLGILFSLRQMDISLRQKERYPAVPAPEFDRWHQLARGAYRLGAWACFGKILLDIVFSFLLRRGLKLPFALQLGMGLAITVGCAIVVVLALFRSRRAHALARELGIETQVRASDRG
jgi:hypothetical protein